MTAINRQWRLAAHPEVDELIGPEHFVLEEGPVPEPASGEVLLRTLALGTSPAQRGYTTSKPSMHPKVNLGEVMRGRGVAVVEKSRSQDFAEGDIVLASVGWQDYCIQSETQAGIFLLQKLDDPVKPYPMALGVLGAAGVTAYFGLTDIAELEAGQTCVVTAAAGGVGSCAAQIARIMGCRVVGIAGGAAKCRWLVEELGVDAAIDYKLDDLDAALTKHCPDGVNAVFDNVGGDQLNTLLTHLALGARVAICGYIATDYAPTPQPGPSHYTYLLSRRARMEGFFVFDYADRFGEAEALLKDWYRSGQLVPTEDIDDGLEHMPLTLQSLFTGANRGIKLCRVAPDP